MRFISTQNYSQLKNHRQGKKTEASFLNYDELS